MFPGDLKRAFLVLFLLFSSAGMLMAQENRSVVNAPEFPENLQWINTEGPLSLKKLKGKYVLLDFWTYCCINCMHVVPDLEKLEAEFGTDLQVIGVHSAKFKNEKEVTQIAKAVERFGIKHPVVNDHKFEIWGDYAVNAWPSVVLINPEGKIILTRSGEGVYEAIKPALEELIQRKTQNELPRSKAQKIQSPATLKFPGKIALDPVKRRLVISDSGRNRIVIAKLDGEITEIIGGDEAGFQDGGFQSVRFNEPQGASLIGETLFIADRKNHSIRRCNLLDKSCETFLGTGTQGKKFNIAGKGRAAELNSPWDIYADGDSVFIAMAGFHQVWKVGVGNAIAAPFSGTGAEALRDGPILDSEQGGAHAQPSGVTGAKNKLYVADSETSSIREISLNTFKLSTLIGKGLFDFGDRDGTLAEGKLQHPLAVLVDKNNLYVADTFNSKIKLIDLTRKTIETISGGDKAGFQDGEKALYNEPAGLALFEGKLYIADTNNNAIRVLDLDSRVTSTLTLRKSSDGRRDLGQIEARLDTAEGSAVISFEIPQGHSFNAEAPNQIREESGKLYPVTDPSLTKIPTGSFEAEIYFCEDSTKRCLFDRIKFKLLPSEKGDEQVEIPVQAS